MKNRSAGAVSALAVLVALAAVVALTAQAGTDTRAQATSSASVHPVSGSSIHGVVSLASTADGDGTLVALTVHGLPANATVVSRLHAGTSLERLSASSTPLVLGQADAAGSFKAHGHILFRFDHQVSLSDIADGAHVVVVEANGRDVAYAFLPRA